MFFFSVAAIVPIAMLVLGFNYETALIFPFIGELFSPFNKIAGIFAAIARTLGAFASIAIQICFYSLCLNIKLLYEQLSDDMLKLND